MLLVKHVLITRDNINYDLGYRLPNVLLNEYHELPVLWTIQCCMHVKD